MSKGEHMMPDDLLTAIQARSAKRTEFGYGIMTADRYVKNMQELVGLDMCYNLASTRTMSFDDVLRKSRNTLVYSNADMVVLDKSDESAAADGKLNLDGIELPKNTLMAFQHVLTTPRKDRDGDVLRTEGAIVDPRMLLLWQHVHTLPIGKMLAVIEQNTKRLVLTSCIVDINELSHDAAVMIDNDMARFSHGFRALEFSELKETEGEITGPSGFDIKKFEIMEESIVSVPSNADASVNEVLLSLVEGGKLTSGLLKEVGKTIRSKMPVSVVAGIDLKGIEHEDESRDGEGTGAGGQQETAASSTPKETEAASPEEPKPEETDSAEGAQVAAAEPVAETSSVEVAGTRTDETPLIDPSADKAGRVLSAANLKMLADTLDDMHELLASEKGMSRGSCALCERCIGRLEKVVASCQGPQHGEDDDSGKQFTVKEAMALFFAESSETDRKQMAAVLQTMDVIKASEQRLERYRVFRGI